MNNFHVGDKYRQQFSVTPDIYFGFGKLFRDHNPLHTDIDFARSKGFSDLVMYGNILNGFISFFIGECLPVKNVIIHAQEIQFRKPVFMNDVLDFVAEIADTFDSVNVVQFKYQFFRTTEPVAKGKFQIGILP